VVSTFRIDEADRQQPQPQQPKPPAAPRPAEVAKAAIQQARVQSKPLPTGAGSSDDWENF
jgi:hypothetical protein